MYVDRRKLDDSSVPVETIASGSNTVTVCKGDKDGVIGGVIQFDTCSSDPADSR